MNINGEKLSSSSTVENYNVNVKRTLFSSKEEKRSLNVNYCKKARYLTDKFQSLGYSDANNSYNFFVKCFKTLSENTVWDIYENATNNPNIKSGIRYFIAACRNQMNQMGK